MRERNKKSTIPQKKKTKTKQDKKKTRKIEAKANFQTKACFEPGWNDVPRWNCIIGGGSVTSSDTKG